MGVLERRPDTAAMPRRRYLPEVIAEPHMIGSDESVASALQRITTHQFTHAIDALTDADTEVGARAAAAMSDLGRVGALLRLVRGSIGADTCAAEIGVLRDIISLLTRLVAGADELGALDAIYVRYEAALRPELLDDLRRRLLVRHQLSQLEQLPVLQSGGALDHAIHQLRRARARFAAWPVDQPMHGQRPIPDSFEAFAVGLRRSYRKGRKCAAKRGSDKWQRHARDLAHQVEALSVAWPHVMAGTVATATDLADVLAERERMDALRSVITSGSVDLDDVAVAVVESLCAHEHDEMTAVASVLATRLYAEDPGAFVERLATYWSTRARPSLAHP